MTQALRHLHWLILHANFFPVFLVKKSSWKQFYVFNVIETNVVLQNLIFSPVYERFCYRDSRNRGRFWELEFSHWIMDIDFSSKARIIFFSFFELSNISSHGHFIFIRGIFIKSNIYKRTWWIGLFFCLETIRQLLFFSLWVFFCRCWRFTRQREQKGIIFIFPFYFLLLKNIQTFICKFLKIFIASNHPTFCL